jgi:hypothetical protein
MLYFSFRTAGVVIERKSYNKNFMLRIVEKCGPTFSWSQYLLPLGWEVSGSQ